MNSPKNVVIAFSKGLSNPKAIQVNELTPRVNFTTSILTNKARMDARKMLQVPKQEKDFTSSTDDEFASFIKTEDTCVRSKKRRLDHLTWEEKLQRKKLKNRVAAQTSRDRKKARLDELEETVNKLRERNEQLEQECTLLRSQNESLLSETKRFRREERDSNGDQQQQYCSACQAPVGCAAPLPGSAAGWVSTAGIVPDTNSRSDCPVEHPDLSSLEELFGDLQTEDTEGYFERLEELASSLMREVVSEMETPHRRDEQVSVTEDPAKKSEYPDTMVGQTSEELEADRVRKGMSNVSYVPDTTSDWQTIVRDTESTAPIQTEVEIKQESDSTLDLDTVYGTYDEATNSITIIYPGKENDDCVGIQECVQEVISTENTGNCDTTHLTVPVMTAHLGYSSQFSPAYTDTMSPAMSDIHSDVDNCGVSSAKLDYANLSDGGYESYDSPDPRLSGLADPWHENFTELFPTLA